MAQRTSAGLFHHRKTARAPTQETSTESVSSDVGLCCLPAGPGFLVFSRGLLQLVSKGNQLKTGPKFNTCGALLSVCRLTCKHFLLPQRGLQYQANLSFQLRTWDDLTSDPILVPDDSGGQRSVLCFRSQSACGLLGSKDDGSRLVRSGPISAEMGH